MSSLAGRTTSRSAAIGGLAIALAFPGTALADGKPRIEWGALIFAHYGYMLGEEAENYNEFDIDRAYLTARSKLSNNLGVRFTTEVGRAEPQGVDVDGDGSDDLEVPEDEKIRVFLKYAYLEWGVSHDVKLRFGSAGTGFVGYYDDFWGQRYIAKSLTDDNSILDSADIGVHALGTHADGLFSWQSSVVNGEGYGSAEVSATKALQVRVTVDPMASGESRLPISAFISQDVMAPDEEDPTTTLAGSGGYSMEYLTLWGEYVVQSQADLTGAGFSATIMPKVPDVLNILARYDHWDPDGETEQDAETTIRTGITRDFLKKVSGALTYERTTTQAALDVPDHGVYIRMQAGF